MRAALRSTGFSQNTALPARTAFSIKSACVSVGVQITTASMSASAMIASTVADLGAMLFGEALRGRRVGIGDRGEARARVRRDIAAMNAADPARAQQSDPHCKAPPNRF